jgi:hypothetical protein
LTEPKIETSPVAAAAALGRVLPRIASAAIALSALGYFIGWREATAYFSALGAPWAAPMLPPLRLLQMSSPIVLPMALSVILSIEWLAKGETARQLNQYVGFTAAVAIALFAIEFLPEKWASPVAGYWCALAGAVFYAFTAGLMIGELIARLSEDRLQWSGHHVVLLQSFVLIGFFLAPSAVGDSRGTIDRDLGNLSRVRLEDNEPARDWRLVEVIGDSALLMSRGGSKDLPAFRVVAVTNIKLIAAPSPK